MMIGSTVQKYKIVRELGSGAMGAVYEAVDTLTERPVAMKVLRAELARQPELIERFRTEAVTLARLNHPNIALLYDFFLEAGDYYMAMEFVRGQSLETLIRKERCLEASVAGSIMQQMLAGLAHAHSMGVLHRDIKPANVLITEDMRVKVTDFGIARVLGSSRMTRHGRIIGTLEYIAPERIRGIETDARSDLYSAGVVLYEMLTGRLPFSGQTDFELIKAQLEQEPPPIGQILGTAANAEWEGVVRVAMAKSPDERFQTAEAFSAALPGVPSVVGSGVRTAARDLAPAYSLGGAASSGVPTASSSAPQNAAVASRSSFLTRSPLMTVLLAATGVMTLLLIFTIVMRIRANNAARTDVPTGPQPTVVVTPSATGLPNGQNNAPQVEGLNPVTPPDTGKNPATVTKAPQRPSSSESRRQAALDALEGKKPSSDKKKHDAALKALDH
jgi:serine/threonine-protein kinase